MSCDFCKMVNNEWIVDQRDKISLKGDFYPGIQAFIDGKELVIVAVADTYEPNFMESRIEIHFCPICGQKLSERKIEDCYERSDY